MKLSRLLRRELGDTSGYSKVSGIYGDKAWVDDLDIVNELGGHSGCVNALSWSRSGRLLASGSDDTHLNIHAYQPESSTAPFALATSISTGHSANIFSIKFMPHSDDRTLITCAGDGEVRIFDIEHSGTSTIPPGSSPSSRGRGLNSLYNGVRYLSESDTNARVYRSHSDRVKRIVTESSPHLFLTCSEDGEVRQWDLRQPSSAYPSPRGGRGFMASRNRSHDDSNVPPPLISYKRCRLDLNTISCSPRQPHYIALGGAHLHCFLHDRRMLGRDLTVERGTPSFSSGNDDVQGELQGQATRCVRRFAPNGCTKMKRTDNNHITACKISDANPNEMVVSWSGDWIYSFDLVRSPGAGEQDGKTGDQLTARAKAKAKESRDRKRKRGKASSKSPGISRGGSKPRQTLGDTGGDGELALRVRYENGQSEDIPIESSRAGSRGTVLAMAEARDSLLSEGQKRSRRIASAVVNLRKEFFALATSRSARDASTTTPGPTEHTSSFSGALGYAATYMQSVDDIMRTWRYPVNPGEEEVIFQQTLRRNRESTRQFLQAAGTIARILGGQMRTGGQGESPAMEYFRQILPAPNEGAHLAATVVFNYDFARAIAAWLDGGRDGLVHCFTQTPDRRRTSQRFPIPEAAGRGAIDEHLIPYLLRLASGRSIPNVDASPFERDEYQVAFETETAAVIAFGNAVKIPFEETAFEEASSSTSTQQRGAALRFWGLKVARGLLMNAAEGVNFGFVDRAFGGLGTNSEEESRGWNIEMGDTALENPTVSEPAESGRSVGPSVTGEEANSDEEMILLDDIHNEIADRLDFGSDDGAGDEGEDEESDDDDDGDITAEERHFMWASALDRSKMRERVESGVPCSSHTRRYSGHCNIRTVKDVNFFGLNDEYVVSGSDSGHVFIWDKKTSELINILEGDGEVVNVVQGHPYEPMLAVSGIDHTIKIFSPDQRAQADARKGIGITPQPSSGNSSLGHGGRAHPSARSDRPIDPLRNATLAGDDDEEGAEAVAPDGLQSRKQMHRSYEIISQNDVERQGGMASSASWSHPPADEAGMRDAYITVRSPLLGVERVGIDFFEWLGMFD